MKTIEALIASSDLTGYHKLTASKTEAEIFQLLSGDYELIGDVVEPAGGRVIKFIGDACLMTFPEVESGIRSLFNLEEAGDRFMSENDVPCRHHVRAHFGSFVEGEIGTRNDKRPDIFGLTVNELFMFKASGTFSITPSVFEKLGAEMRATFEEHEGSFSRRD